MADNPNDYQLLLQLGVVPLIYSYDLWQDEANNPSGTTTRWSRFEELFRLIAFKE